jgi:nucleotide-binding universal stress UspA family protein
MTTVTSGTLIEIKNILFLTDFSASATVAAPYAAEIAKQFGAKLHVLHAIPPIVNPMTAPSTWPMVEEAARISAEEERKELLAEFSGIPIDIFIEEGDLGSIVDTIVEKNNIDLIVVGTRGRTGLAKLVLGSTAERIFRHARCPVLTVGPFATNFQLKPGKITSIVYATDFSAESTVARAYALSLAQELQAHLTLLHVIDSPKPGDLSQSADLVASLKERIRALVPPEAELWCDPECVVEQGPTAETILQVAKREDAGLIVLGVRWPTGFPGAATHLPIATAHQVVSGARCPVLTVRH